MAEASVTMLGKVCTLCKVQKPYGEFSANKDRKGKPVPACKQCRLAKQRNRRNTVPDYYRQFEWPSKLKIKYGITPAQYYIMLETQNYGCATCGSLTPGSRHYKSGKTEFFYVDHCHSSGRVRGLLCLKCNTAIGLIGDNPGVAAKIAAYLDRS